MAEAMLRDYLNEIGKYYQNGIATEHTYRGTLQTLLEKIEGSINATYISIVITACCALARRAIHDHNAPAKLFNSEMKAAK